MQAVLELLLKLPSVVRLVNAENTRCTFPLIHRMLSMSINRQHQAQLLGAWLQASKQPVQKAWQMFLDDCTRAQVIHF